MTAALPGVARRAVRAAIMRGIFIVVAALATSAICSSIACADAASADIFRRFQSLRGGRSRRLLRQTIHLALHQLAIDPFAEHENIRRAVLNDTAGLQDHDAVEIADRGKSVRDRHNRASVH
jgi:hypothetical protein